MTATVRHTIRESHPDDPRMGNVQRFPDGTLYPATFPGLYPLFYLESGGETLCAGCADNAESGDWPDDSFRPVACGAHYEGSPIVCAECNAEIESAYGDPEAGTE